VARRFFPLVWRGEEDKQYLLETAPFLGWEWPFLIWSLSWQGEEDKHTFSILYNIQILIFRVFIIHNY
jgi:hypothetical protein